MTHYAIIAAYREPPCTLLLEWLQTNNVKWEIGSQAFGWDCQRNNNLVRFLTERDEENLLLIDGDKIPIGTKLLTEYGDLLWLSFTGEAGSKAHEWVWGAGCCRISRDLLEIMPQPYFKTTYNEELTERLACECDWFGRQAVRLGHDPRCVGAAGHQQGGNSGPILLPGNMLFWPHQWSRVAKSLLQPTADSLHYKGSPRDAAATL